MLQASSLDTSSPVNKSNRHSGITEIVLPECDDFSIALPSLAYLTQLHADRWLTWISLKPRIDRGQLESYGFQLSRVRVVYPKTLDEAFWLFWEALAEGNSHTVVGTLGKMGAKSLTQLERAASLGRCMGLLLRGRDL